MELGDFKTSLSGDRPPDELSPLLEALWFDAKGDWRRAHGIAQDEEGRDAARVHAYLHRKEGDLSNAGYWYRRAGESARSGSLDEEWESLADALLKISRPSS